MAKNSSSAPTRADSPRLTEPIASARTKLAQRIAMGREIIDRQASSAPEWERLKADEKAWSDYGRDLLRSLFTTNELMNEFLMAAQMRAVFRALTPAEEMARAKKRVSDRLSKLQSIIDRLELFENREIPDTVPAAPTADPDFSRAFVVHGHDEGAREAVARFLMKLGVEPIILHEQASGGRTIIEKLEHYGKVPFAVVLLTPDDEGRLAGTDDDLKPRARQNVLLELGFFVGLLGRENVCALCKQPIDVPSDWDGVVWVPMDEHDGWKVRLAKELRATGFTVDASALL